jgi:hypothetical protein
VRLRGALGEVRQQIKWLGSGVGLLLAMFIAQAVIDDRLGGRIALLDVVVFLAVPITAGIAILRYRLYEIDRVVSRTVSYAAVVAILSGP